VSDRLIAAGGTAEHTDDVMASDLGCVAEFTLR
jgi:hypothetical protein